MKSLLVLLFGFTIFLKGSLSDIYSAVFDMIPLIETEDAIVKALEKYVTEMDEKLNRLKSHLLNFQKEHEKASKDVEKYVHNPINAFLLTKRLTSGWREIQELMLENLGSELVQNISLMKDLQFPDDEDLSGAADALVRIQETYDLDLTDMSRGILNGTQFDSTMTADDCFEIGKQSYEIEDHNQTVLWMSEAYRIYSEELYKTVSRTKILEYLSYSLYVRKDITKALQLTNELLDIDPNNKQGQNNKIIFEESIQNPQNEVVQKVMYDTLSVYYKRGLYDKLCSKEVTVDEPIKSKLKCRYVDYERPFLKLAKLKEEELYLHPKILLYHDVLYDKEIRIFQEIVKPNMERAEVFEKGGTTTKSIYRVSKVGWLENEDHPFVGVLNQRVEDITGLTTTTGEPYQMVNYGIGGFYASHYDWLKSGNNFGERFSHLGDRIGTLLFYMSDVEHGGATVFPFLKVAGWPVKGTAIFWPNLHFNGTGNNLMLHAACPVITGSKWIINKWLHERGQEFRRPCALTRYEI